MTVDNPRVTRLKKHLDAIIHGKTALTKQNNPQFIEAICAQPDPATCVNKIIASSNGLSAVQNAMRYDLSTSFFNGNATTLLTYIQAPELAAISDGSFLNQVLLKIVEPPIFWSAFIQAFREKGLQDNAQACFAWLLLQLIFMQGDVATPYREVAADPVILDALLESSRLDTRAHAQKIKHMLSAYNLGNSIDSDYGPGGRHDNDFVDYREINILPTADEMLSTELPFLRLSKELDDPETEETRLANYLDNQFRLYREDMIYEMREELQIALGKKTRKHRSVVIEGFKLLDKLHCESSKDSRSCKWGITLECQKDLDFFNKIKPKDRKQHLDDNRKFLRHQSMACLIVNQDEIVAFPTVYRDEDLLSQNPPTVILQIEGDASTQRALLKLKNARHIKLIQIDTALFSYEPVLRALQETNSMPLTQELLFWKDGQEIERPSSDWPGNIVQSITANPGMDIQSILNTSKSIVLDQSQTESLLSGLTQKVSLIQGPPGTGKSFIGALLAKALHDSTSQTILVVCYTNHALDQFLEDLLDIGIPESVMVRLGGKSTPRTANLSLYHRKPLVAHKRAAGDWKEIDMLKQASQTLRTTLESTFSRYHSFILQWKELLEYLEFEAPAYYEAFQVPVSADGMSRVGRGGRAAGPDFLLNQWSRGFDAGMYRNAPSVTAASEIWSMPPAVRQTQLSTWYREILKEQVEKFCEVAKDYNECQEHLEHKMNDNVAAVLRSMRIIGCTTTAAAKYRDDIRAASPDVLLVEEAGEILESHILTALGAETKQLILIGDHKQLRPKVNNYKLTVEKDEGYDLNRSLFERLVFKGFPHVTLSQQHRMRPEISSLVRHLTYPDLVDAPATKNRPNLRGISDNVVFIEHCKPEDIVPQAVDSKDHESSSSKQNTHEVLMVLKILRYLGQQGYGTDKTVILTPYLGQLRELREALKKDNDPVLNDLDSFDLVKAGLMTPAAAGVAKNPIRLATIDNYQGEESEIVIVSFTRSNSNFDIGFMSSPQRLNVLLSRARNALIMIGNAETFMGARKGKELYTKFFNLLKKNGNIYGGLPVKCERHPKRTAVLKSPDEFDLECPDGGCNEPCGTTLNCGVHPCPSKCHQLSDHSKMTCEHILYSKCPKGHSQQYKCHKGPPLICAKCDKDIKIAEKKQKEDFDLQQKRDAEQRLHDQRLAEIDAKISLERQALRDVQLAEERDNALRQKQKDLDAAAKLMALRKAALSKPPIATPAPPNRPPSPPNPSVNPPSSGGNTPAAAPASAQPLPPKTKPRTPAPERKSTPSKPLQPAPDSPSQIEWKRQKDMEGAQNDAIDDIMQMTGLEAVKEQVLKIKVKIDTTKRQGTSLKDERFNIVLLGNPGTGKTTVARHYGKFLASVDVLPGLAWVETTGSALANDGVPGIKKMIEDVIKAGGGTIFVDEAYQLASQSNFGGSQVLDFMLAEMENRVGTIVFIFAGYNKEMEKFFEHNPGLDSRVPYRLKFDDYTDAELLTMLQKLVEKKYNGQMQVEDGIQGLYGRIAIKRLGRGRGSPGFGNARALHNMFSKVSERQAQRLNNERREGTEPNDFLLLKEDLIGPDPSKVMVESKSWKKLQSLIGLGSVKASIQSLFALIDTNYQRELIEKEPMAVSLNRVFIGSPGTGKTTVAKLYGQILADLGMISNGEVVLKNPADFIGSALGESEKNTKGILANTIGKVLVIDEAYMLYGGASGGTGGSSGDPYKTAVIDTIVAEVQSVPGEDRCVLLLGYKDQIVEMFQNVNPGFARRFAIENAFSFEDFTEPELMQVLEWKLQDQDLEATDEAKRVAMEVLSRAKNRPNFGNGGEVENVLSQAKARFQTRQLAVPIAERSFDSPFEPQDFDPEFNRNENAASNLTKLFEDVVGCEEIVGKLGSYQQIARTMKSRGMDPRDQIPTNFVFKGPPGTGKTTTARKMGQVYFDMGFLSSTDVLECSASDLVGQYVGQTGPKTKQQLEKALGKVLFVDEAYRLSEGHFAKEAMDELVGLLTQERFRGKMVVILAGYDQEMNNLLSVNPGLSSRFPEEVVFRNLSIDHCLQVLAKQLRKANIHPGQLEDSSSLVYAEMVELIQQLSSLPSWGNARDLITLSKKMITLVLSNGLNSPDDELTLAGKDALVCTRDMLQALWERAANVPKKKDFDLFSNTPGPSLPPPNDTPPPPVTRTTQKTKTAPPVTKEKPSDGRDPGVSDAVWFQLQVDKAEADKAAQRWEEELQEMERQRQEAIKREAAEQALAKKLAEKRAKDAAEADELKRQREQARLRELEAKAERDRIAAILEKKRQEEMRKRQQEAKAQAKLRQMGVCVAGFQWIKQPSGYRCAGGSHFVGNDALGI